MARTRRQVTLQEQESGVPASPPQSLPTASRPTRAKRGTVRNNNNNNNNSNNNHGNTTDAPADPSHSAPGGRIGKAKRVGRSRTQPLATTAQDAPESSATDVDGPEASDSLTQTEDAVQATLTARKASSDHERVEGAEKIGVESSGETHSPSGESALPVQVQDMTAHPVPGPTSPQERPESATSLKFREILNISPRSPGSSTGRLTPTAIAQTTPVNPTSPVSAMASPLTPSPLTKPAPQAPSPASQTPVYYIPSNPEHSHSLITIRMDHFQGLKDPVRPSKPAAFAVPSELIAPICRYIESRAKLGSDLSKLTTDHPHVEAIVHGDAKYRPQLPSWQSRQSPSLPRSTMKDAFIRRAQRKRGVREMEEETVTLKAENAKLRAIAVGELREPPQKRTKVVPDPWNPDGKLVLGRTKEIEVDEHGVALDPTEEPSLRWSKCIPDPTVMQFLHSNGFVDDTEARKRAKLEEARRIAAVGESPHLADEIPGGPFAESEDQAQPEQVPETPRARRWGLSSFLPSARSVTKYIPFSSRLTTTTPERQLSQPQNLARTEPQINANSSQAQREPEVTGNVTGPQVNANSSQSQREPDVAGNVTGPVSRRHQSASNQQRLLTKQQSEEEKRIKKMRAQLRKEADALDKQKKDLELAKKDLAEQQKSVGVAETPGQKRKRKLSPDVIPLPANGSYGMVDEYFIVDSSSDEEDLAAQETPTKERPLKKVRTSAPDDATLGSPYRARPYTGTLFAHPDAQRSPQDDNVFVESDKPDMYPALNTTPIPGPTLTFKVPSPGSSDSDEEEDEDDGQEQITETPRRPPSSNVPMPKSILRNSALNQSQSRPAGDSTSPSKTMVPPPRPNPGHATLPAATTMTTSDALEKAREKALRHQPKQPSTLRESSRLSTSTVNSDPGDEGNVEEYDPRHPAIVSSPSKVPVSGQPLVSSAVPAAFQQPSTQAVSKHPHEQQAALKSASADDTPSKSQESADVINDAEQAITNTNPKIKADLDRWWKEHGDDYVLDEGYEDFEEDLLAEEQDLMDGPNGDPYVQPHNIISAALDRIGADGLSDRGIQTDIEDNWRPGDLERTESDPANGMRVFFNRLVKNGDIERDLADRVIEIGVPPEIIKYLAGQETMGPVAA